MSFEVCPTHAALDDAEAIGRYIADQGFPGNAERWVSELIEVMAGLSELPHRCGLAPESVEVEDPEIRHLIFGNYRILFTISGSQVFILHVRAGHRMVATREELAAAIEEMEKMRTELG